MRGVGDFDFTRLLESSVWGMGRCLVADTLAYPLEVIKTTQQQLENREKAVHVARRLYQTEGLAAFYRKLHLQLVKELPKQAYVWPLITNFPPVLGQCGFEMWSQQALTGIAIAALTSLNTPVEKARVKGILGIEQKLSWRYACSREAWRGHGFNLTRSAVSWSSFLVAQNYFIRRAKMGSDEQSITLAQSLKVGIEVSGVVTAISAPFDVLSTRKLGENIALSHLFAKNASRTLFRGLPLAFLSRVVKNTFSAVVIDRFRV